MAQIAPGSPPDERPTRSPRSTGRRGHSPPDDSFSSTARAAWQANHAHTAQLQARSGDGMRGNGELQRSLGAVGSDRAPQGLGVQLPRRSPPTSNSSDRGDATDVTGSSPPTSDPTGSMPDGSYAFPPHHGSLSPHVEPFSPTGMPGPSSYSLGSPNLRHVSVRSASTQRGWQIQTISPSNSHGNLAGAAQLFHHSAPSTQNMTQSPSQASLATLQAQSLPPDLAQRRSLAAIYQNGINDYGPALQSAAQISPQPVQASAYEALRLQQAVAQQATAAQQVEEISTIFVVGFPDDMQEREFQNLFTFATGFEAATLKVPSKEPSLASYDQFGNPLHDDNDGQSSSRKQTIGFAKFRSRSEALDARDALSGRRVDAEKGNVLKAEMAKKNLHTRRGIAHDTVALAAMNAVSRDRERERDPPSRMANAFEAFHSVAPQQAPSSIGQSLMQHIDGDQFGAEDVYSRQYSIEEQTGAQARLAQLSLGSTPSSLPAPPSTRVNIDNNPPINTLYVGGLPSSLPSLSAATSALHLEDAIRATFSRCPGFRRLNFRQKSNGPMVFIEFEDVTHATRALNELYGNTLGGIVKSGIRLSYSKNPLGVQQRNGSVSGPSTGSPLTPSSSAGALASAYGTETAGYSQQLPLSPSQSYSAFYAQQSANRTARSSSTPQGGNFSPFASFAPYAATANDGY